MRAQVEPAALGVFYVYIKRVLHRTRRMVFRVVQGRKTHPIGFDFRAIGHFKPDRRKDGLDALNGARHRVKRAHAALPTGQGDVQRFKLQLRFELRAGECRTAVVQSCFNGLLDRIDLRALALFFGRWKRGQPLEQFGHAARLAEVFGLGVFKIGSGVGRSEIGPRGIHKRGGFNHRSRNAYETRL